MRTVKNKNQGKPWADGLPNLSKTGRERGTQQYKYNGGQQQ